MNIFMPKSVTVSEEGNPMNAVVCEQYLPGVYQYVYYWVKNTQIAEDLTISTLKEALVRIQTIHNEPEREITEIFTAARYVMQSYLRTTSPELIQLSLRNPELEIISLKFGARLSNPEIAKILRLSEAHVGRQLSQYLNRLSATYAK